MVNKVYNVLVIGMSDAHGGVETYIRNMIEYSSSIKFRFFFPSSKKGFSCQDVIQKKGVRIIQAPEKRGFHFFSYYLGWMRIFHETHFDIVYINDCSIINIDVLRIAKFYNVPVRILHSHSTSNIVPLRGVRRFIEWWNRVSIDRIATGLFSCSQMSGEWMFGVHRKFKIIRNAIDLEKFSYSESKRRMMRKELDLGDFFVVGFVGSLSTPKFPEFFIQVFAELKIKRTNVIALVVGDGKLKGAVQAAIAECGLDEANVRMLGVRTDVDSLMNAMDCFVMTSRFEGFPYVLVEAQASGLPCVVADTIAEETNITGNVQFISLNAPPDEWALSISRFMDSPQGRDEGIQKLRDAGYDVSNACCELQKLMIHDIETGSARIFL